MVDLKCDICDKAYKSALGLKCHTRSLHQGVKYHCDLCGKIFSQSGKLKTHKKVVHEASLAFKCDKCDKRYENFTGLKQHKESIHQGIRYECDICDKLFKSRQMLEIHKRHDAHLNCEECDKHFTNPIRLENHKSRSHKGIKYFCDRCDKRFSTKSNLNKHKIRLHSENKQSKETKGLMDPDVKIEFDDESTTIEPRDQNKETFCKPCDQFFQNEIELVLHVKIYHTISILKCNRCPKVFDVMENLLLHTCEAFTRIK